MKNKNVAVCGGCGFLGSHLVEYLIAQENNVLVLDNLMAGRFFNPKSKFHYCDIAESEYQLLKIFEGYDIDYVFNYAAIPYVPTSYERPLHTFDINARGALMVMNAAQEAGVKGILQVSSAEIYGDAVGKIDEDWPARPHSTYGASKLAIDTMVQTRFRESGCPVVSLRQFNCLGERDVLHPYVVPEIYRQLINNDIVLLGNNSFRDFMYAGDAVRIAVELLEKGMPGEVYNLGSEEGIKIYELAEMIGKYMGKKATVIEDPMRKRKWEIWHLESDNTKIYKVVEQRATTTIAESVRKTIEYYQKNEAQWAF